MNLWTGDEDRRVPVGDAPGVVDERDPVQRDVVDVGHPDRVPAVEHPHGVEVVPGHAAR